MHAYKHKLLLTDQQQVQDGQRTTWRSQKIMRIKPHVCLYTEKYRQLVIYSDKRRSNRYRDDDAHCTYMQMRSKVTWRLQMGVCFLPPSKSRSWSSQCDSPSCHVDSNVWFTETDWQLSSPAGCSLGCRITLASCQTGTHIRNMHVSFTDNSVCSKESLCERIAIMSRLFYSLVTDELRGHKLQAYVSTHLTVNIYYI